MKSRLYWAMCVLTLIVSGCTNVLEKQEPERRAQFETSIEVYRAEHANRPGNILDALSKKQIVRGMNLDEVRLVLDAQGIIGRQTERLWCDKKPVGECPQNCSSCNGLIVSRWGSVIYFKGKGATPVVFDIRHTDNDRPQLGAFLASDRYLSYEIARAIEAGQIIIGMTLDQIRQTLPGHDLGETYQCKNIVVAACTKECANCIIDFVWQGNTVLLIKKANDPLPRVTRIAPMSIQ